MSNSNNPQPALVHLIRPAQLLHLFRHHPDRKTYYFEGCNKLWGRILTQPPSSPAHQQAYRGLILLTQTIKDALARQKEAEQEKKRKEEKEEAERVSKAKEEQFQRKRDLQEQQHQAWKSQLQQQQQQQYGQRIPMPSEDPERAAFRTLVRHIATREAIPTVAEFEAGLSAFQNRNSGSSVVDGAVSEQDAKLARDDVETALDLLKVNVDEVSVEEVYAGLTLLDLKMSVRVEEYLEEMEKGGR